MDTDDAVDDKDIDGVLARVGHIDQDWLLKGI